jgi:RNA polymerase primary sigma factor
LLTAEQEVALARRLRGEDVRVPGPGESRPTPAQARDRLVEQNIGLVLAIVRKYRWPGVAIEDLVQEGILGLREATDRFDPDMGCRFSTYAFWWVHQAMRRAMIESSAMIRVPPTIRAQMRKIARAEEDIWRRLGRHATAGEIASQLEMTEGEVLEVQRLTRRPLSLHQPVEEQDGETYADRISDPGPSPEAHEERQALAKEIRSALDGLEPRERQVMTLRFGIGHNRMHTPDETAQIVGLSRQGVFRLEERALARLRSNGHARRLRAYL